jgi:hypothetical protein
MTNKLKFLRFSLILASAVTVCILTFGFIYSVSSKGLESSEAAGWMQAIGSVAAIFTAIWVSSDQHRRQESRDRQRDEDEVNGMLCSLRSEVETSFEFIQSQIGSQLEGGQPNTAFMAIYPVPEEPFKIYYGLIPKLGMIRDSKTRNLIVSAYSRGQSLVLTCRYNNELIEKFRQASRITPQGIAHDGNAASAAEATLKNYGDALRANYRKMKCEVIQLLAVLPKD